MNILRKNCAASWLYLQNYRIAVAYTDLFKMVVGVLTTCHTPYT